MLMQVRKEERGIKKDKSFSSYIEKTKNCKGAKEDT